MTDAAEVLEDWNDRLSTALGVPAADVERVLELAGLAAHSVVRPAAPLSTFLLGYATAARVAEGADPALALAESESVLRSLAASGPVE